MRPTGGEPPQRISGDLREPVALPTGAGPGLTQAPRVRVILIDGLSASTAATLATWSSLCKSGLDLKVGDSVAIRLGVDFQIFFDEGEDVKTLRLGVGLTF